MSLRFAHPFTALAVSLAVGCSGGSDPVDNPSAAVASVTVTTAQSSVVVDASVQMLASTLDASGNVLTGRAVT
jgi:hypothetical protein